MQKSLETALQKISSKLLITDKDLKVVFINNSAENFLNKLTNLNGQALHAQTLEFIHPTKKKWVNFEGIRRQQILVYSHPEQFHSLRNS